MTAHVTFVGGGLFLPFHTPYDRQVLRDHVLNRACHVEQLRIDLGRKTWIVERPTAPGAFVCARCNRQLTVAGLHAPKNPALYCVACALS